MFERAKECKKIFFADVSRYESGPFFGSQSEIEKEEMRCILKSPLWKPSCCTFPRPVAFGLRLMPTHPFSVNDFMS